MDSQQTLEEVPQIVEKKKRKSKTSQPKSKFQKHIEKHIKDWVRTPNQNRFKTAIWKLSSQKYIISMSHYDADSSKVHQRDTIIFHHTDINKIMSALQSVKRIFHSKTLELFKIDKEGKVVDNWNASQIDAKKQLAIIRNSNCRKNE